MSETPFVLAETSHGVVRYSRDELLDLVRADLAGSDVVGALLAERRAAAALEDA